MKNKSAIWLLLVIGCADVETTSPPTQMSAVKDEAFEIVDLGMLGSTTQAFEIDDHGTVYGRWGTQVNGGSFRWTEKDGFEDLGGLDGQPFLILGSNKHGVLTGHIPTGLNAPTRSAVYLPHRGYVYVDDTNHAGNAWGANKFGVVVGVRFPMTFGTQEPFIWTEADGLSIIPLEFPGPARGAAASRILDNGTVGGTLSFVRTDVPCCRIRTQAYLWDATRGTQVLPSLSVGNVAITGINSSDVAVGAAETRLPLPGEIRRNPLSFMPGDVPIHAWRWSPSRGLQNLSTLGGKHAVSWGVDEDGNAYGWAMDAGGVQRAVRWNIDGSILQLPSLGGPSQTDPPNKHGVLVGSANTAAGEGHGVIWIPKKK
ncbi:MAG TPA: hypothetical protein VM100_03565 [Longimicrobiales bacterium]|nr:hypothetical protein [Longimicrobiales bacterium]